MFWWAVTICATMLAAAVGIQAVTKFEIGAVVLADDGLRRVDEKLRLDAAKFFEELLIAVEMGVIGHRGDRDEPVRRLSCAAAAVRCDWRG